jgi:flagellar M-ring protein FliF
LRRNLPPWRARSPPLSLIREVFFVAHARRKGEEPMNEFMARIVAQVRELWTNLSHPQRLWAGILGIGTLLLLISVIFVAQRTVWVELGSFEPQMGAQIKTELDKRGYRPGVDYKFENDARTVYVDARLRNEVILALNEKGLIGNTERGFRIFDDFDITQTDYEQRLKTLEALKSEMRHMIRGYAQVEDVAISVPHIENQSLFIEKETLQSAAVMITLKPGASLTDDQIKAVRNLIAAGFAGLKQDQITLTDQFANLLVPEDEESGRSTKQARVITETSRAFENDIRKVLGPVLGSDKFTVSVNAEFDWDNVKVNMIEHSSPGFDQLKVSEQEKNENLEGQGLRPGGEPGTSSNTPPVYNSVSNIGPIKYSNAERIVNYLANQTITDRIKSPQIKRVTAAVAIDGTWKEMKDTDGKITRVYMARTAEEMDHIKALVQSTLSQNLDREDLVEVRNLPWDRTKEFAQVDAAMAREEFQRKLMLYGFLSTPLLLVLLLLYAAWRRHVKLREEELARQRELERQRALAAAEQGLAGEISLEDQERQEIQRRAASLARAKPKLVADLIRTWMAEDTPAAA